MSDIKEKGATLLTSPLISFGNTCRGTGFFSCVLYADWFINQGNYFVSGHTFVNFLCINWLVLRFTDVSYVWNTSYW